jgi:hypothetical protein
MLGSLNPIIWRSTMSATSRFSFFLAVIAVLGLTAVTFAATLESVDFSKPPQEGAKFKVTETQKMTMKGTQEARGQEIDLSTNVDVKQVYTHKILAVKENKVTKIEREYEDSGMKQTVESSMSPEPREQETPNPVAWKTIRADIQDDTFTVKVKDGDEWTEAEEKIRNLYTSHLLRYPLVPLPDGPKEVGESWELEGDDIKKIFPPSRFGEQGGEVDGSFKGTLEGISEINGTRCAVLKVQTQMTVEPREGIELKINLKGTAHYSLAHNFVIGMVMKGTVTQNIEIEMMGTTVKSSLGGDLVVTAKVKVLENLDG